MLLPKIIAMLDVSKLICIGPYKTPNIHQSPPTSNAWATYFLQLRWTHKQRLSRLRGLCKHSKRIVTYESLLTEALSYHHSGICGKLGPSVINKLQLKHALTVLPAMVLYEYLVTFPDEIRLVWKRPWTLASVLLLSVRGNMVANSLAEFLPEVS